MASNLAQRVIAAVVLIPLVLGAVMWGSTALVAGVFAVVICLGAMEWAVLSGYSRPLNRWLYGLGLMCCTWLLWTQHGSTPVINTVLWAALAWWVVALALVIRKQTDQRYTLTISPLLMSVLGLVNLLPAWLGLVVLHGHGVRGPELVVFLFCLIWLADSGAYFAGRRFGKRRLAARVSPGKTWEGALGALLTVAVLALLSGWYFQLAGKIWLSFVVLCLVLVPVSILGDLAESLFKREAGVKDSGQLIPGHGGVLDRIDSLMSATPVFVVGVKILGVFS